jgi:hypothetical protein
MATIYATECGDLNSIPVLTTDLCATDLRGALPPVPEESITSR